MNDYAIFSGPEFDPNEYANTILAGETYSDTRKPGAGRVPAAEPLAKEDISVAISKLTFGIDDVSKEIKNVVTVHHEDLLAQAASAGDLSGSLTSVRAGLDDLDQSLDKLRGKIRAPYHTLQSNVARLRKLQQASDVLRRTSRFVVLARRLQAQMEDMDTADEPTTPMAPSPLIAASLSQDGGNDKERSIAKAALSIAELVALLDGPDAVDTQKKAPSDDPDNAAGAIPLRSVNAVAAHVSFVEDARAKVTAEMQMMVISGLSTLNQSLLASSLQTAYNLRVLPELVQNLIADLSQTVEDRIRSAFDISKLSKDALSKDAAGSAMPMYKSRVRTEPTNMTAPQWTAALWSRLEGMVEEMADACIKVYTLEKVLIMKRDMATQVVFLDEAMKLLENKPSAMFWAFLGRSLDKHSRDSAKGSAFLQQTLSAGYPRLLRLFHEFFAKIAVHTDTVYIHTHQSPETIVVLRSLANFEALYLARSSNKFNEAIGQAFSGGSRAPPGSSEGANVARTVSNELDSARFDPLLVKSVAKSAMTSLDMMLSRADGITARDRAAVVLVGPTATSQQISNGQLASFLYQCWLRLNQLGEEHSEGVMSILKPCIQNVHETYKRLMEPMETAVRRELGAIIAKLHRIDLKNADPMAGMAGASVYMKELAEKLSFIKAEILTKYNMGDAGRLWVLDIVKFVIRTFVLHVSIAKPLGESGKLQLTSDMTELEFALSAFLVENPQSKRGGNLDSVGEEYRVLRAMRHLLFLENSQLASQQHTLGVPPLIVLHHILVRSPIPLPHSLHGWQEAEYVRWVDEHSEVEAWTLVESGVSHWEKVENADEAAGEYVQLAQRVLLDAQKSS
ncbi:Golgi transport complex subunit 5-domain-containing protein [Infundibulicybe gibba]|nr:Golgi transport complex subunit 5-domain-containing protein [Infundibulicybe gibba]